jgi:biopolymer transport protein ExbB/TolQ
MSIIADASVIDHGGVLRLPDGWQKRSADSFLKTTQAMKTKRRFLIAGIVAGSLLTLSPLFGLLGTVFGMTRAFATLGNTGIADPTALSNSIGTVLLSSALGLIMCPFGVILLTVSIVFYSRLRAANPPPLRAQQMQ